MCCHKTAIRMDLSKGIISTTALKTPKFAGLMPLRIRWQQQPAQKQHKLGCHDD